MLPPVFGKQKMAPSDRDALLRFLQRLLRRSQLSPHEQQAVLDLSSQTSHAGAYRDIVSPGQRVDHSCLIVDGLAARFDQMRDGRRQLTALHLPGDMCDLHSVVAPIPGWGIQALTATTVAHIPHSALRALVTSHPAIALAFWRDTTLDASILAKWTANLGRKDSLGRLAHLLCEVALRSEQAGLGTTGAFPLPATQAQLADALGITPVHVNRMFQRLRKDALVRCEGRMVHIGDWSRLATIADFDPGYLLIKPREESYVATLARVSLAQMATAH